jgi:hypothetical protein
MGQGNRRAPARAFTTETPLMNPADNHHGPLPRYGIRDDEKTRPYVVLFDWDGNDEAPVHASPIDYGPAASSPPAQAELDNLDDVEELDDADVKALDDIDLEAFRPRWHGVGRRPGAVALAVVLGVSFAIGAFAVFGSDQGAESADASALLAQ